MTRCSASCVNGKKCKKQSSKDTGLCWIHSPKELITCGICLDESYINSKYNKKLNCGHIFCDECIKSWIVEKGDSSTCPTCRDEINAFDIKQAECWGVEKGLLFCPKIKIFSLTKFDFSFEFVEYFITFISMIDKVLMDEEQFNLIEESMTKNQTTFLMYQELISKSIEMHTYVKTKNFPNKPKQLFMFSL